MKTLMIAMAFMLSTVLYSEKVWKHQGDMYIGNTDVGDFVTTDGGDNLTVIGEWEIDFDWTVGPLLGVTWYEGTYFNLHTWCEVWGTDGKCNIWGWELIRRSDNEVVASGTMQ